MNRIRKILALSIVATSLTGGVAFAQDHHDDHHDDHHNDNHGYVHHDEWKKGYHMNNADWNRGGRIDYHQYHLSAPRRGYEWRQVDGNYVMAAIATGVIASVVVASAAH
jgi:Ni/Co efflux regulator RcnB